MLKQYKYVFKFKPGHFIIRCLSTSVNPKKENITNVCGKNFKRDDFTNVTPKILNVIGTNLHTRPHHPLSLVRQRIVDYFYKSFLNNRGNPLFSIYDNLSPLVTIEQNFDSLLVPQDHPSRSKKDCYYLNREHLLRAHTTCHQSELIQSGLDNFLIIGDVYRRDEIDKTHYPVFHQVDGVRLKTRDELFPNDENLQLFQKPARPANIGTQEIQLCHTLEAVRLMEHELKSTLIGLAKYLFGDKVECQWVDTTFPFTQPSWELEIFHENKWMEILGCGIMKQQIITNAGVNNRIGWAFGIGLERLAMCLYQVPDIRLFWSNDSGFLNQFATADVYQNVVYKPISQFPQCINDISFWLPENMEYSSNDFYDLIRTVGGDIIEQVSLIDEFQHPKSGKISHCYRIVYRHMEKTLTQEEVNTIHKVIELAANKTLKVVIR